VLDLLVVLDRHLGGVAAVSEGADTLVVDVVRSNSARAEFEIALCSPAENCGASWRWRTRAAAAEAFRAWGPRYRRGKRRAESARRVEDL